MNKGVLVTTRSRLMDLDCEQGEGSKTVDLGLQMCDAVEVNRIEPVFFIAHSMGRVVIKGDFGIGKSLIPQMMNLRRAAAIISGHFVRVFDLPSTQVTLSMGQAGLSCASVGYTATEETEPHSSAEDFDEVMKDDLHFMPRSLKAFKARGFRRINDPK